MLSFIYSLKKSSNSLGLCYRIEYAECVAYFLRLVLYYSVFQKRCALLNFGLVFFFFVQPQFASPSQGCAAICL